jgi:hypothetical protein
MSAILADNGLEAGIEPASLEATDHARANGYDASILIDLCKAILAAKAAGKLSGASSATIAGSRCSS